MDECSIGPLGSIMKRPWTDATSKTRECYIRKASTIISEVLKTVAPQSAPELWEAVRGKNEVSHLLGSVHNGSDLLLAAVESYKQADTSDNRRQLLSLVASNVTYAELVAHISRLTRYEFTAARRHTLEVGAGLTAQSEAKQIREKVDPVKIDHFLDHVFYNRPGPPIWSENSGIKQRHKDRHSQCNKDSVAMSSDQAI